MKPLYFDRLQDQALKINGKTREMLEKAPTQEAVWKQFVAWCQKFNRGKTKWTAPIPVGMNIDNFDSKFVTNLNKLYFKKEPVLFHPTITVDLLKIIHLWFEDEPEPKKYNMDALRDFFGMSKEGAHDALVDVRQTADLVFRFLHLKRRLQKQTNAAGERRIKFAGCCARKVQA